MNGDYWIMFIIMILSSLLSTMNVWADKVSDIRFSLNDLYMAFLMTGWMFLFMGLFYGDFRVAGTIGVILVVGAFWCIRTQAFVGSRQYLLGMIPHHSMAVHMSRALAAKPNRLGGFLEKLVENQGEEIAFMKIALNRR